MYIVLLGFATVVRSQDDGMSGGAPVISGTLASTTGFVPTVFMVFIAEPGTFTPSIIARVAKDGTFRIEPDKSLKAGIHTVCFAAVDHVMATKMIYLTPETRSVRFNVVLRTNRQRGEKIDSVAILTDFTDEAFERVKLMERKSDGTYISVIPLDAGKATYQVIPFTSDVPAANAHSINGTMQSSFEYDLGGDFRSVIKGKGKKITITWDPKDAPVSDNRSLCDLVSAEDVQLDSARLAQKAIIKYIKAGPPLFENDSAAIYQWRQHQVERATAELDRALSLPEGRLRDFAISNACLSHLPIVLVSTNRDVSGPERIVAEVPPASDAWSINEEAIVPIIASATMAPQIWSYLDSVIKYHPLYGPGILYRSLQMCEIEKDEKQNKILYERFMHDYSTTDLAENVKRQFDPNRAIMAGKLLPEFDWLLLDDSTKHLTSRDLRGKYVLINIWATWSPYCVSEIPFIESAREKFLGPNFDVLNISLDADVKDINTFRTIQHPMPWNIVFSQGLWKSEAARILEAAEIPRTILVDPDGRIVAVNDGLRATDLEKTLERYLHNK
ncbi:MAG: TlpA disulfide reductase family protein [Candidatus Kapabacteria bacterium]|nr:TlpA disulfide reductase family protein [Candidatus Kapabacteria bacterium]